MGKMQNDRIYKSMSLDDFIEQCSFVMAKGNIDILPEIQNFNYRKGLPCNIQKSEQELQETFINMIISANPELDIHDYGKYYSVWTNTH